MESVLQKTVASLERALRYNPENIELMVSLAEGYIRMGRLDKSTIELCEKILTKYPEKPLIQQAQAVAFVIEQADEIDAGLAAGKSPPSPDVVQSSIDILKEFLGEIGDLQSVWLTYARLCLLAGQTKMALEAIERLRRLGFETWSALKRSLDWVASNPPLEELDWDSLYKIYNSLGDSGIGQRVMEKCFDEGKCQQGIGPVLLKLYLRKYTPANPSAVPENLRPRLFQVLLDYGEIEITGEWMRKAALFGWEINNYSKEYVKELVDNGELSNAFEILQRMAMDHEVRDLLNEVSLQYENNDLIDEAVRVLQYINSHELVETEEHQKREAEIACEMELSMAELHLKNGRMGEALTKLISAVCLTEHPLPDVVERIDEILETGITFDPPTLFRLAVHFRALGDQPKAVYYLNHIIESHPGDTEALEELHSIFDEVVRMNPDNPELRFELGRVYQHLGRFEDAIAEYKSAATSPILKGRANRLLASLYMQSGQFSEALGRLQEVTIEQDTDLESLYGLHEKFVEKEDLRSALAALDKIARFKPDYRDVSMRVRELTEKHVGSQATPGSNDKMRELIGDNAVGRYRYLDKVGSGGMGVVHKVVDLRQQKVVAMKILRDGLGGSSKALDRFFREARIAASIHHRNIVEIYDYNISSLNGHSYICMEFVDGPSLREFIDRHYEQTISINLDFVTEMLYYVAQLLDALDATHLKGIIHRDIKPDNIMINSVGEVKITDFGIVHVEEATFTPTGAMLGTPRYMSPEQVTGAKIDGRSDIYSVGILLYEVLTGSPPFMTGDVAYQQVNKKPVEPRTINAVIPQSVNDFIMKCLEKTPDDRFSNAKEAKAALTTMLSSLGGCKKYESRTLLPDEEMAPPVPPPRPRSEEPIRNTTSFTPVSPVRDSHPDIDYPERSAVSSPAPLASDDDLDIPASLDPDLDL